MLQIYVTDSSFSQFLLLTRMHSSGMHTARLLTISQHALHRGSVHPSIHWPEGCLPGGGVCQGGRGVCPGDGVSAQGGVCWGVSAQECVCGRHPLCEQNDWQTGVKTLPCRNFVAGGKYQYTCLGYSYLHAWLVHLFWILLFMECCMFSVNVSNVAIIDFSNQWDLQTECFVLCGYN